MFTRELSPDNLTLRIWLKAIKEPDVLSCINVALRNKDNSSYLKNFQWFNGEDSGGGMECFL